MICEKCQKNTGSASHDKEGKASKVKYQISINKCNRCQGEFCDDCWETITNCPCCGKTINKNREK